MRSVQTLSLVAFTTFLVLFYTLAFGQEKRLTFGLGAGATYSTFNTPSARFADGPDFGADYAHRLSWYAEAIADVRVAGLFSVQTGLKFIGKGAAHKEFKPGSYGYKEGGERLFMMEVPVLAMLKGKVGSRDFNVGGGIYFAYMLSGMRTFEDPDFWDVRSEPLYRDLYKRKEMGLSFKIEYGILEHLKVVPGYEIGLTNLIRPSDSGEANNSALTLGLNYYF